MTDGQKDSERGESSHMMRRRHFSCLASAKVLSRLIRFSLLDEDDVEVS